MFKLKIYFLILIIGVLSNLSMANSKLNVSHINQQEFEKLAENEQVLVVDVRTEEEYQRGFIPGAVNIPHKDILSGKATLDNFKNKKLVFYCRSGVRAGYVTDFLRKKLPNNQAHLYHLKGDYLEWEKRGRHIATPNE